MQLGHPSVATPPLEMCTKREEIAVLRMWTPTP